MQPDTIIPDLSNPQGWNRYSYVTNRPIIANDPTGHDPWWCDSKDHAQECQDNWISSRSSKVNARVYYLNAIGLENRGTISPNSEPDDEQGYLIYRIGLIVGPKNVTHIPIYKGDTTTTRFEMFGEMFEKRTWSSVVADTITKDVQSRPLSTGEKLILVGNSGGGTVAIESLDLLEKAGIFVDQAILRGSPVKEHALNNVGRVDYITSNADYYYSYDSNSHDGVDVQGHQVNFWGHVMRDNATRIKVADLIAGLLGK